MDRPDRSKVDVSVIIPAYNGEEKIDVCVQSLIRCKTDGVAYEIIIVDDCSTDDTQGVCQKLEAQHPTIIKYYRLTSNSGVSAARNTGIAMSKGRFITFVDCDDFVTDGYLSGLLTGMSEDVDLVCCGYYAVTERRLYQQGFFEADCLLRSENEKEELFLRLLDDDYGRPSGQKRVTAIGVPWAKLFRADIIQKQAIAFPEGVKRLQDNLFVMRYARFCRTVRYMDAPLYCYSIAHSKSFYYQFSPEVYQRIQKERDAFFNDYPNTLSRRVSAFRYAEKAVMLNAGIKYCVLHEPLAEAAQDAAALTEFPEFQMALDHVDLSFLSKKQRIYLFLYRMLQNKRHWIVCVLWKLFLTIKEKLE